MRLGYSAGGAYPDHTGPLDQNAGTPGIGAASHAVYDPRKAKTYNVVPGGNAKKHPNTLVANETDVAEALTAVGPQRRSDRGTMILGGEGRVGGNPVDPQPDGPRYAAMGDAVTVNTVEWIAVRLRACIEHHEES